MASKNTDKETAQAATDKAPAKAAAPLLSLSELASMHRGPTWLQAGVCRLMDWAADKKVTEAEYTAALERTRTRPLGGRA